MKRLLGFILPVGGWVLLSAALGALTTGAGIALLATSAWLISTAALQPSIAVLGVAIVGVRFFGIARGVLRYLERLVSHNTTFRLLGRIRLWFYRAIEPLAPAGLEGRRGGDLLARALADIESLENFYVRTLAPPIVAVVVVGAVSMWMGSFDLRLGLTLLGSLLLAGALLPVISVRLGKEPGRELVENRARLQAGIVDMLQGMPELLLYDGMQAQLERLGQDGAALGRAQRRMGWIASVQSGLAVLISHLGVLALLALSIPLVNTGRVEGVSLAVILLGALASFEAVQGLPAAAQYLESNLAAARRLFEIADATPLPSRAGALPSSSTPTDAAIAARGLGFSYSTDQAALSDVSFDLPPGRHTAVVGPSGAGKSTLVQLLLRFREPTAGSLLLDGKDLRTYDAEEVRACFSSMLQGAALFQVSLRENLLLADPQADEARLMQALELVRLDGLIDSLPQGLETLPGEGGRQISGGERQRFAMARCLLRPARVYLFDEPTANLDTQTERQVVEACCRSLEGRTMLWITHRLVGLERMDEILVMDAGRIVQRGRHAELVKAAGLYRELWELQNRFLDEGPG